MKLQMQGTERIQASPEAVRRFVGDPAQVGRCLPDLEELEVVDGQHLVALVRIGVGPVRGRFKLEVALGAEDGELSMRLKGSGMGSGLQMSSQMQVLAEAAGATALLWTAEAMVSGPLASVGERLLDAQARKTTQQLFESIRRTLEANGQVAGK
jgi:carbon monoxide dehydrogenase subunit G